MMNTVHILKLVRSGDLDIDEAQRLLEEGYSGSAAYNAAEPDKACGEPQESKPAGGEPAVSPASLEAQAVDDSLGYAAIDLSRPSRTGFPEVIYGEGKTAVQIAEIFGRMIPHTDRVLATRIDAEKAAYVQEQVPGSEYHMDARALTWTRPGTLPESSGYIAVLCAGTSDLPVAEEAAVTAESMGSRVERIYDVGVAGIHRLFRRLPEIRGASAIVVAAGMEGALASVVGGLVAVPVIAVPTSIGYGASFQGMAALLSMLNACAPGISVVNIDNGFGAGYNAALIHHNQLKRDEP
ncbi:MULTISPECIES: nickel pincer cofactor biosynthesis protein LarB [Paenibacillus]|uniref:nickel pincer cofactor biosynthesis protein LarB n=1 Tax=Paenibacillus TaxID=44249 RepID=UPI0022B85C63|nr:nickel pincer cofactor biosynthesis protein LarB [Paenibacillus caseinilyticus]MCZ8522786.1 nickel pincer cofactor biosynthesis protein LarB [Paenibacillus caseinilyticus]